MLLNLISNGFYAATKRKAEKGGGYRADADAPRPRTSATASRSAIRDNGTGIPPEVKEKMFNPFFTTKPAGEGTGLGLSMSHDIIVKQHGGTIEVDTAARRSSPNSSIALPRAAAASQIRRERERLILVVDDEPDVEDLFRQQFRRDLRAGRFAMDFAAVGAARRLSASRCARTTSLDPDPLRHQHAGHERARAAAAARRRRGPTCRSS